MRRVEAFAVALCVGALLIQLVAVATAPFTGERLLAWAPFHEQAWFRIEATVAGLELSDDAIEARYHLRGTHWSTRTHEAWQLNELNHVFRVIEATEALLPEAERAEVLVHARVNGAPVGDWRWPR